MNPSYGSLNNWEDWNYDDYGLLGADDLATSHQYQGEGTNDPISLSSSYHHPPHSNEVGSATSINLPNERNLSDPFWALSDDQIQSIVDEAMYPNYFDKLTTRKDPPSTQSFERRCPRFEGDLYTALWVRGEGTERAGWCGFCSSWHKLRDSAFWYHMHYSHGIIHATGRQIDGPQNLQWNLTANGWEGLCGGCKTWIMLGKGADRAKTTYFRHAYKCHVKDNSSLERPQNVKQHKPSSRNDQRKTGPTNASPPFGHGN